MVRPTSSCPCGATWGGSSPAHCGSGCHRTFAAPSLFDAHRDHHGEHGHCLDPATVKDTKGERRLWFRDGMWRGPEMSPTTRAAFKGR